MRSRTKSMSITLRKTKLDIRAKIRRAKHTCAVMRKEELVQGARQRDEHDK